jgi:hypothetical protein
MPPPTDTPTQLLIPLRGASGKLYGMLDVARGVIVFQRGKQRGESIDLTPYFKAAKGEK